MIDFYFDFASPYAYLAHFEIEPIAERHGRAVRWRPIMLGPALAATGSKPNLAIPLKGAYLRRDIARIARERGWPLTMPAKAPILSLLPARAFYGLRHRQPERAVSFAKAVWRAHWGEGRDISDGGVVAEVARAIGLDGEAVIGAAADRAIKSELVAETDASLERGVFGAPFFFVDDEPFWGCDHLATIDRWLEKGGW